MWYFCPCTQVIFLSSWRSLPAGRLMFWAALKLEVGGLKALTLAIVLLRNLPR